VEFHFPIKNAGWGTASGLEMRLHFDPGLEHSVAPSPIKSPLRDLEPGEATEMGVELRAIRTGKQCLDVEIAGTGGIRATAKSCITIGEAPALTTPLGPGSTPGEKLLHGVVTPARSPSETLFGPTRVTEPLKEPPRGGSNAPDGVRLLDSPRAFQEKLAEAIFRQRRLEKETSSLLEEGRKSTPTQTPEEIKKRWWTFWEGLEAANKAVDFLRTEYATQVRLLELDLLRAEQECAAASSALSRTQGLGAAIAKSELDEKAHAAQAAEVRLEQRKAILQLYLKIPDVRTESPKASELPKTSELPKASR